MSRTNQALVRIITTVVAGVPLIICTMAGSIFFLILMITLTMLSINEYYFMIENRVKNYSLGVIVNSLAVFMVSSAFFAEINSAWRRSYFAFMALTFVGYWLWELFKKKLHFIDNELMLAFRALFYIGFSYSFLILIRESDPVRGFVWMFFLISSIWINDGMAYLLGMKFGKHRLNPSVSPKKSVEGALAGLISCLVWSLFLGNVLGIPVIHSVVLGVLISVLAQAGDLTESLLKREMKVKDSGGLLPGHGGVLDRMDSFILTAPIIYYYTLFFKLL